MKQMLQQERAAQIAISSPPMRRGRNAPKKDPLPMKTMNDPYCGFLETASQEAKDAFYRKLAGILLSDEECGKPDED
jgi:hypothetical protein